MTITRHDFAKPTLDVVVLTAGQSSRLGKPKQHISLGGKSLLHSRLDLTFQLIDALNLSCKPIVVSGAFVQQDCLAMAKLDIQSRVTHLYNAHWVEGMKSSLSCVRSSITANGTLILLVDQYRISLDDLVALYDRWIETPERPAAARFADTIGPPAIWPQRFWSERATKDHAISKTVLRDSNPTLVDLPNAEHDLDTAKDMDVALKFYRNKTSDGIDRN